MKQLLGLCLLLLVFSGLKAQEWSFGFHLVPGLASMKVSEGALNEQVSIQRGPLFLTGSFGLQAILRESRDQSRRGFYIKPSLLLEASLCRCGGNVELITTLSSGNKTFDQLNYVQWQGNYSFKGMLEYKKLRVFIGPNLSYNFYSGVYLSDEETPRSANNQFKKTVLGYEAGIGTGGSSFFITARYRGYFTDYGLKSELIPTVYRNNQLMFSFYFFILGKNREKNRDSIFWD